MNRTRLWSPRLISPKRVKAKSNKPAKKPRLAFNLHHQTVAVVIGKGMREQAITKLIHDHHGQAKIVDAFYRQSDLVQHFRNELSDADIVVMVQNYMKHITSKTITSIASAENKKFAISNGGGLQSIEQAIYRADAGIKAYENSSSSVDYPTK